MIFAAALRELMAAGLTGDALIAAMERIEAAALPRRTSAAIRQERYRHNKASQSVTSDARPPDKEIPPTPPKEINPSTLASLASVAARARDLRTEFDRDFWPRYPNKVGKPAAFKAFTRVRKAYELPIILFGLDRYVAEKPPNREWLNPATFLNQERFNDQPASPPTSANGHGKRNPYDALLGALADQFAPGTGQGGHPPDADAELHDEPGAAPGDHRQTVDLGAGDYRRAK